uniref:Uncharacterized protein n=1 Tax=Ciona savignyi TaxID=51511 RepID=H2ZQ67_CIOSA
MDLDPKSAEFNPLLALYSVDELPNVVPAKVYDNIAVFEANLSRTQKNATKNQAGLNPNSKKASVKSFSQRRRIQEEVERRDLTKLQLMVQQKEKAQLEDGVEKTEPTSSKKVQRKKPARNLFTSMEKLAVGPMSLLHKITSQRLRSKVYTRNFCGLRGVLVGFIAVFDRFMNLAMVDVDETFQKAPLGDVAEHQKKLTVAKLDEKLKYISLYGVEDKRSDPKCETNAGVQIYHGPQTSSIFHGGMAPLFHRHLKNVYVRGDSIVLISISDF